jgi:hypothetical protein
MMFAEIAANPAALPLWGVFVFAALMYPLGLLLPGCPCCGGGNCTTCGSTSAAYEGQATGYGRMCCTGTIPGSVTVRVTRLSAASIVSVHRGSPDGSGVYTKTTTTIFCSDIGGDYVLSQRPFNASLPYRDCGWGFGATNAAGNPLSLGLAPDREMNADTFTWPQWQYYWSIVSSLSRRRVFQRCSGFPDVESCNPPTSTVNDARDIVMPTDAGKVGPYSVQQCSPAGTLLSSSMNALFDDFFSFTPSGCTYKFEVV